MASDEQRAARRPARSGLVGCLLLQAALGTAAAGAEQSAPDLELLAYLGSWPETDEDWAVVAEWDGKTEPDAPEAPEGGEENSDEDE